MAQNKEFIVSSATVKGYNASTGAFMFSAECLVDSALTVSMTEQEVRGGFGNQKLFSYYHSRTLEANLTSATWEVDYLALNVGSLITNGADSVYKFDECITLSGGAGVTGSVPVGNVFVKKPNGAVVEITPTGSNFTVPGLTNEIVKVTYRYSATVDKITIDSSTSPMIVKLVMQSKVFDNTGQVGIMEITIPRFQTSGSFELSLTSDGVSSTAISGMALAYDDGTCTGGSAYATVKIIPVNGASTALAGLAMIPGTATVSSATPTKQLSVIALPASATRANYNVDNASVAWVSSDPSKATVSATGLVTRVATGSTVITATYLGVSDTCTVTVSA